MGFVKKNTVRYDGAAALLAIRGGHWWNCGTNLGAALVGILGPVDDLIPTTNLAVDYDLEMLHGQILANFYGESMPEFDLPTLTPNDSIAALEVPAFVAGLLYGFTGENHLIELQSCFDYTTDIRDDT